MPFSFMPHIQTSQLVPSIWDSHGDGVDLCSNILEIGKKRWGPFRFIVETRNTQLIANELCQLRDLEIQLCGGDGGRPPLYLTKISPSLMYVYAATLILSGKVMFPIIICLVVSVGFFNF